MSKVGVIRINNKQGKLALLKSTHQMNLNGSLQKQIFVFYELQTVNQHIHEYETCLSTQQKIKVTNSMMINSSVQ